MEIFLGGLLLGLTFGWYLTKYKLERKIEALENLILEQDELVHIQSVYIDQSDKKVDNIGWDISNEKISIDSLVLERKNKKCQEEQITQTACRRESELQ